jgi:WS/DGAT/MGAT family acyltransferase
LKPLSGLDSLFLHLETPATPMHVGAVHLLERPPRGGDFLLRVRRHVARRMHLSPVFTRQLASMPLDFANPVWVRADRVDLERHVVRVTLPPPGSLAQLEAAVARLHSQPLDRSRPLWRFHVIEGLAGGGLAFYTKIHHATLDGASGVALAQALLDLSPTPRTVEPPRRRHPDHPGLVALVGTALKASGSQTVNLVRSLPTIARVAARLLSSPTGFSRNLAFGPRAPFNRAIDPGRSFATASLPLAEVRRIAAAHGATLNDVVLALVSGALRSYLEPRGGIPRKSMVAAMPVSLREAGNTEATTLATMTLAALATKPRRPARPAAGDPGLDACGQGRDSPVEGRHADGLPVTWIAVAAVRRSRTLRAHRARRSHTADRQPRRVQRARTGPAAVPRWRPPQDLLAGVDRRARTRPERHAAELCRLPRLRHPRRTGGHARCQAAGARPARGAFRNVKGDRCSGVGVQQHRAPD